MRTAIASALRQVANRIAPVAVDAGLVAELRRLAGYVEKAPQSEEVPTYAEAGIVGCSACDNVIAVVETAPTADLVRYLALCGHAVAIDDRGTALCGLHRAYGGAR